MKKILLAVAIAFTTTFYASAQTVEIPKNILSVRGGLTLSNLVPTYDTYQTKAGFQIEVVDQIRLCKTMPLYLETGLFAAEKGSFVKPDNLNLYYVGVPLTINYHWTFAPKFTLDPQIGFYYAYLVGTSVNGKAFSSDYYNKSDFGFRCAVGVTYDNRWSLRLGYEAGFLNVFHNDNSFIESPAITNSSYSITLGINFITIGSKW